MKTFMKTFWAAFLAFFAANVVMSIVVVLIAIGAIASAAISGSKSGSIENNSILKIDLSVAITDQGGVAPFGSLILGSVKVQQELSLLDVVRAIDAATIDRRIKGIYLQVPLDMGISTTNLEEIRSSLENFKASGKFVVSYAEVYPQAGYYLASVADQIFVNPEGGVAWQGMAANVTFFKGLFDKLEVEPEVIRHGDFKSAIEPYILTKMSAENREQYTVLLETLWGVVVGDVARSRGISPENLMKYANDLRASDARVALECNMVSALKYQDEVDETLAQMTGEEEPEFLSLSDYIAEVNMKMSNVSDNKIAIVYAEGGIVSGSGDQSNIGSEDLTSQIVKLRKDDDVKAVVLRVNSPGGSALAAEVMWREIELLRKQKPVVVSMGSYAASGGYYIACPADLVVANRMTLTGSIGVFGLLFNAKDGFENKLGITFDGVKTNPSADMGSISRPLTSAERVVIQKGIERVYDTFIQRVADGRRMSLEQVDRIGGGRVWSGVSALEVGLIDNFGGLKEAIAMAVGHAGVGDDYMLVGAKEKDTFTMIMEALSGQIRSFVMGPAAAEALEQSKALEQIMRLEGVQARGPELSVEM